jgi:hypothetical protein
MPKARMQGENQRLSHPSQKANPAKGFSRNVLCALCLLFVHPLVFNPPESKGKEESIPIE